MTTMEIPGIPGECAQKILDLFLDTPKSVSIVLFGSRAKGNFREGSDIDLAAKGLPFTVQNRDLILERYESLNLPWKLDLVIYDSLTEVDLKAHIDHVGITMKKPTARTAR